MDIIDEAGIRLTLPVALADRALSRIPESVLISNGGATKDILVRWELPEASYLASLIDETQPNSPWPDVPSPMLRDYTFPGIYTPFDHQQHTASFLSLRSRAYCFSEMGTAKTAAAVWAADYLMTLGLIKRVLVICPLSIMYSAWQADIFRTAMHRSVGIAHGSKEKRTKVVRGGSEFVIINYDGVNVIREEIYNADFGLVIIDEANAYKSVTTKRWKTLAKIITPDTRLWLMTGTPASQSPVDAFGLAKLVSPDRIPRFLTAWRDKVMYQITRFKWLPRREAQSLVFNALQPAIRYTKAECLDLPEIMYETREVPLTVQVASFYKKLKSQMMIEAAGETISAVNAAASLSKLLQISGGAVYTDERDVVEFDVSPRLAALKEVLDETSNKVVVFVPFLHTIEVVRKYLTAEGISNEVIKGDVNAKERSAIINRFQTQEKPRILVIQPQSASHGVTLTAADTVVFWSPVVSVETYLQCVGRINRVGQKNTMTVVHLQGSDAERKTYQMLQGKIDDHVKLVDLYNDILKD